MCVITIGRSSDNDVVINDPKISRHHAQIVKHENGTYSITDLASTNGTYVNGRKIQGTSVLRDIDKVSLAKIDVSWQSFNPKKTKEIIKVQEEEIVQLKQQLAQLEKQLNEELRHISNVPIYDMSSDGNTKYKQIGEEICSLIKTQVYAINESNSVYRKVFPSVEIEKSYYIGEYRKFINSIISVISVISDKTKDLQSYFDSDMMLLGNNVQNIHSKCIYDSRREERNLIENVNNQINTLRSSQNNDITIDSLKQYLSREQAEISSKYKRIQEEELKKIFIKRQELKTTFDDLKKHIISSLKSIYNAGNHYYISYFNNLYETSKADMYLWNNIDDKGTLPSSLVMLGSKQHRYYVLEEELVIVENCFIELLNNQNLIIRHNSDTKQKAHQVVNTMIGRLMASSSPGKVNITMIDTDEMDGTCDVFKFLNRNIFQILARPDEIRRYLEEIESHIGNIIQNLLLGSVKSLFDYNQIKDNKESYHVIIIEDFPVGINNEALYLLQKILKNGVRTGVNVILLVNEDKINSSEDARKAYNSCNFEQLERTCSVYDFTDKKIIEQIEFDSFTEEHLRKIVQYVNEGVETREDEAVLFSDYMLHETEWWTRRSAKYIEVPFGVSENKAIQQLRITQESGQNSVVVIGIPGSGKSVFLHALICSAAINYSPDELNMYLIDFSGVEFNAYVLNKLPHARVIAPEAEREFGLSILNELVEEGARRMALCRDNNVSNIVDLKAKNPSISVPRLLVIIDEFQKIFEIENDNISKEANAKIHIIIQEFRKFGINLVLATQKLPSSYILPKDLIANRVVFKSSPADFSALITLQGNMKVPQLRTGECIYNSESGSPFDNRKTQGFLILKNDIDNFLNRMAAFAQTHPTNTHHDLMVFRGNDLPSFTNCRYYSAYGPQDIPAEVGIYFGESIAIDKYDVHTTLRKESGNNILIVGGETSVAQRIAYHAALSATKAHTAQSAYFFTFNFMRREDPLNDEVYTLFGEADSLPFDSSVVCKLEDVQNTLTALKEEVEKRRADEEIPQNHIYLTIYAFQLARMFDKGGRRGDDVSECGLLLDYVLKNGPAVGVFTILQCNNYESLLRIGNPLAAFTYRIALQMSENDSNKIISTSAANKLFMFNRPSSKFRAYYRDNNRNITNKFKPYK